MRTINPRLSWIGPVVVLGIAEACGGGQPDSVAIGYTPGDDRVVGFVSAEMEGNVNSPQILTLAFRDLGGGLIRQFNLSIEFSRKPLVVGVVGHEGSGGSLLAASTHNASGVPNVVPTATSSLLGHVGEWVFPMVPNDSVQGAFIADWIERMEGVEDVFIFFTPDQYGVGLKDGMAAALSTRGISVIGAIGIRPLPSGTTGRIPGDLRSIVRSAIRRGNPDVAVLAVRSAAVEMIPALTELVPNIRFVAGDGVEASGPVMEAARDAASLDLVSFLDPDSPSPVSRRFRERFERMYSVTPSSTEAARYDALKLMIAAVTEMGATREDVRRHLTSLGRSRPEFTGVTGDIDFVTPGYDRLVMQSVVGEI